MNERQKLAAERAAITAEGASLMKVLETRAWTEEETAKVDAINAQLADLDARIVALESMVETELEPAPAPAPTVDRNLIERITKLENAMNNQTNRRTAPAPVGTAPSFVRDLNDRQVIEDQKLALRGWLLGKEASRV